MHLTASAGATGYADPAYAASLSEYGTPRLLPGCQGSILVRDIPGHGGQDAMGPYPLFSCLDSSQLAVDVEELSGALVSVLLVLDPFGDWRLPELEHCFADRFGAFKEHYVTDLSKPAARTIHAHHRRNVARALRSVEVDVVTKREGFLDEWQTLYAQLVRRYGITGIAAFSRRSFARQFRVRGFTALRAMAEGETVGAMLWYERGPVAYYHLGAYSHRGYELGASFALVAFARDHFAGRGLEWLSLGAGAGVVGHGDDGLSRFKRGWATGTRAAYLCGRILDRERYAELANGRPGEYFPAYRKGEFV
jgi:Acetyltransferase (GNAT) domain